MKQNEANLKRGKEQLKNIFNKIKIKKNMRFL